MRQDPLKNNLQVTRSLSLPRGPNEQFRIAEPFVRAASHMSGPQSFGSQDAQDFPTRFAQQDVDIRRLSKSLDSLQDRMLALEKAIIQIRMELRASGAGCGNRQDLVIDSFEAMLGAMKDTRYASQAMEDLRAENEELKQRLRSKSTPTTDQVEDERPAATVETAAGVASTAAPEPPKKKRAHAKRKSGAHQKSVTPAASATGDPDSSFCATHDQDGPSQIGGLAALDQITAAMSRTHPASPAQVLNGPENQVLPGYPRRNFTHGIPDLNQGLQGGNESISGQPDKGPRFAETITRDVEVAGSYARKKRKSGDADTQEPAGSQVDKGDEPRITAEQSALPCTEPQQSFATQLQNAAAPFEIAATDEMMIDPALRSATMPINPELPVSNVLASIENPPDQRKTRKFTQQESNAGMPVYDSVHESRIRDYKARDALRKRKSRAKTCDKKKQDGEDQFKQEEKIRAREKMVRELMEREEMLENDGDL
jgi:hypothetical protein